MIAWLFNRFARHLRIRLALSRIDQKQSHAIVMIAPSGHILVEAVASLEEGKRRLETCACDDSAEEAWIWERGEFR
jgi:hypothetical protein